MLTEKLGVLLEELQDGFENWNVHVYDKNERLIAYYNGRNSIPIELNDMVIILEHYDHVQRLVTFYEMGD